MSSKLQKSVEGQDVIMSTETTVYVIDISGSMGGELIPYHSDKNKKIHVVRDALKAMLQARLDNPTADRLGFVTFGGAEADVQVLISPKTASVEHQKHVAAHFEHGGGGTPMLHALQVAAKELANADNLTRIVLLSDGEPTPSGSKSECLTLIKKLSEEYGFVIDTVGIGVPGRTSEYDEAFMKMAAKNGAGEFYPIEDPDQLCKLLVQTVMERRRLIGAGVRLLGDGGMSNPAAKTKSKPKVKEAR